MKHKTDVTFHKIYLIYIEVERSDEISLIYVKLLFILEVNYVNVRKKGKT